MATKRRINGQGRPPAVDRARRARRALSLREKGQTWHEVGALLSMTRQGARQLVLRAQAAGDLG
jgi:hypothetical protein